MKTTVILAAVAVFSACRGRKSVVREFHVPPLLGVRNDVVVAHLRAACPSKVLEVGFKGYDSVSCDHASIDYEVGFDPRDRVSHIALTYLSEDDLRDTFDHVIAPILPDETREIVRTALVRDLPSKKSRQQWIYQRDSEPLDGAIIERVETNEDGKKSVGWMLYGM